jgi:hypothetical protein
MDKWIEVTKLPVTDDLAQKAIAVVDRVLTQPSELWICGPRARSWNPGSQHSLISAQD